MCMCGSVGTVLWIRMSDFHEPLFMYIKIIGTARSGQHTATGHSLGLIFGILSGHVVRSPRRVPMHRLLLEKKGN